MAATQKGTTLKIGFGAFEYTGFVAEEVTVSKPNENVETIKDADGATMTKILMDPKIKISMTVVILDATGSITPPVEGAAVTLVPPGGTSATFNCDSADVKHSAGATRLTMTISSPYLTNPAS
jgi:hypothetical protein